MPRDPLEILWEDRIRLTHMLESATRSLHIVDGMTESNLRSDEIRLLAVVKSIEIIGEASTKVSDATCARLPNIDWLGIRGMRNRMVHGYDSIDVAVVWRTIADKLPPLIAELKQSLATWPAG